MLVPRNVWFLVPRNEYVIIDTKINLTFLVWKRVMLVPGEVKLIRETFINGFVSGTRSRLIAGTHRRLVNDTRRRVIVGTRRRAIVTRRPVIKCWYPNTCNYCNRRRVSVGTLKRLIVGSRTCVIVGTGDLQLIIGTRIRVIIASGGV